MPKSSAETKARLVEAAAREFASFGIAGARTERIANEAQVNGALLHRYFGTKQQLFDHVFDLLVVATVNDVPITPDDLPGYAGRLFDYYDDHAGVVRLALWQALERPEQEVAPAVLQSYREKVRLVSEAQDDGRVSRLLPAGELLTIILQLSLLGGGVSPGSEPQSDRARRRESVVVAVEAVTRPTG